jgi:LemA protein
VIALVIALAVIAVAFFWIMGTYNGLVGARNVLKNAFSQIDVQLKRRYDLIPNLVETAKGYKKHEAGTLEAVIAARNQASAARTAVAANPADETAMNSLKSAEGALMSSLGRMNVVMEAYPDLKANQNMMQLTEELTSTENKISFARQAYNDAVMTFNNKREMFPSSVIAGMFNFSAAQPFEITNTVERENVKVAF